MPARGDTITQSLAFTWAGDADSFTTAAGLSQAPPGAEAFSWTVPAKPHCEGIRVRSARATFGNATGVPHTVIDIQKSTTSILASTATTSATAATTINLALANNGSEIFEPGNVMTIDITKGTNAKTWSTSSAHGNITVQVDFDWLGCHTGGGVRS